MSRSSLLPEHPMFFSPALAATIGLEEAILLQQLGLLTQTSPASSRAGFDWFTIQRAQLLEQCAFWTATDLHRISRNLAEKAILLIESPPLHTHHELIFAFNESSNNASSVPTTHVPPPKRALTLRDNWTPSDDIIQLLQLNHAIPRDFALAQIDEFILYWRERGEPSHAWNTKFRSHVMAQWRRQQASSAPPAAKPSSFDVHEPLPLDRDWRPSADALEILARNNIDGEFIEQAIPEFILYWRERGSAHKELNSRFIQHIRLQWARYTSAITHSTEPTRIAKDWAPSRDVYDILKLSHIDRDFADKLIPEFIVFWLDSNQLHTSWNSKFLQHVKFHWARQHQISPSGKGASATRTQSLADDLSDTSWAQ